MPAAASSAMKPAMRSTLSATAAGPAITAMSRWAWSSSARAASRPPQRWSTVKHWFGILSKRWFSSHQARALRPQGLDVVGAERGVQHDHAVAAAFEQDADTLDRLGARVLAADAEGDHHVQAGAAQFGVDDLQDRGVEGAGQQRDIDADHAAGPVQQRARRVRRPVAERIDRLLHPFELVPRPNPGRAPRATRCPARRRPGAPRP
jgi:hypothetical protein